MSKRCALLVAQVPLGDEKALTQRDWLAPARFT